MGAAFYSYQVAAALTPYVAAHSGLRDAQQIGGLFFGVAVFLDYGACHDGFDGWQHVFYSYFTGQYQVFT